MNIKYNEAFFNIQDIHSMIRVFEYYGNAINKNGQAYLTRCEFHNDTNPSIAIFEFNGVGFYKCLSCGEKGNVVSYIKKKENCNGVEALVKAYEILGLNIEPYVADEYEGLTEEEIKQKEEQARKTEELKKERNKHLALLHKNYDKAFLKGAVDHMRASRDLIEEYQNGATDFERTEIINHAMFKADVVCEIDKYISEDMTGLIWALQEAHEGKRVLMISPTGTGKNYTTIKVINDLLKYETVLVGPNASNIEQTMNTYQVAGAYGDLSVDEAFNSDSLIKTMTWDKTIKLKDNEKVKDHILLLDEADQIFRDLYREKAIRGFNDVAPSFRGRMDMTGTPTKLNFDEFDFIVEYKQRKQTNYQVKLYNGISESKMLEIINNSKAFGMLYDNKDTLEFLNKKTHKNTEVLTSENKKISKLYKEIMENSSMADFEGCLNTSVMVAGVNIKNDNISDIIVAGVKDIGTIKQYVARYRGLEKVNVHIFNNYPEQDGQIYSIEEAIKREVESIEAEVLKMNLELLTDEIGYKIDKFNLTPLQSSGEKFYRDAELGVYKANTSNIRGLMYSRYYSSRSIKQFKVLLEEQFNDVKISLEIIETDEDVKQEIKDIKKDKKEAIKEAFEVLEQYKEKLIGYAEYVFDGRVSEELDKYWRFNKINPFKQSIELEDLGVNEYFKHKKVKDQNKIFTKYVVEYGYSIEYAWKMSQESKNKRTNAFKSMNLIAYRVFKEELPQAINNNLQEVKLYETIDKKVGLAQYYTAEGVKALTEELKEEFKAFGLHEKEVSSILKLMYDVKEIKINSEKIDEIDEELFLKGIKAEKKHAGKRVGMMKINSYKNIDNLKEELAVPQNDNTIEKFINNKIKQFWKLLDDKEKASLKIDIQDVLIPLNVAPVKQETKTQEVEPLQQLSIF